MEKAAVAAIQGNTGNPKIGSPKKKTNNKDKERRALNDLDVADREGAEREDIRYSHDSNQQPDQRAACEGRKRQEHRPSDR